MFHGDSGTELEAGYLRSERRFSSGKRKKTLLRRGSYSTTREEVYKIASHVDEGSYDEEDEYQPISDIEEE